MKLKDIVYTPEAEITFTRRELYALAKGAASHYDGTCRSAAAVGGFIYGYVNMLGDDEESVTVRITIRNLDLLCKIAESPSVPASIYSQLTVALTRLTKAAA